MRALARRTFIAAAVAASALALAACNGGGNAKSAEGDIVLGNANAPVTVVEYASITCGHCAAWNQQVWPEFKAKYVDTGKVKFVFREFLTPPVEVAAAGFLVARCAGDDKYHEVVEAMFRGQQEMFESGDPRGVLLRVAQSAGMSEEQFNTCVTDEEGLKALQARVETATKDMNVQGTPTFFVNDKMVASGAVSLEALSAEIDPLLAASGGAPEKK